MAQITLENKLLESMASIVESDLEPEINNLDLRLGTKFRESHDNVRLAKKVISIYGGIFHSMKSSQERERAGSGKSEDEFFRTYWAYVAAEGTLQYLARKQHVPTVQYADSLRKPEMHLKTDTTDRGTLNDIVRQYSSFISNTYAGEHIPIDIRTFLSVLKDDAYTKLQTSKMKQMRQKHENDLIVSSYFRIDGIKKPVQKQSKSKESLDSLNKGLQEHIVKFERKEDIVGNKHAIDSAELQIDCLLHYDPASKTNHYSKFNQFLLFAGMSGTGKTMTANYVMTYAKMLAEAENLPLSIVKLDFEDRFQCGPLENIKDQLKEISRGDRMYVVFMDEIDTKIPSRNGGAKEGHKNDIVGEFLRFRGGGDYPNYNNYLIVATTNEPKGIDPAILRVFNMFELEGPKTAEEKMRVLYNNLREGMQRGYVQVKDWRTIGITLENYGMSGGNIKNIADMAEANYMRLSRHVPRGLSSHQKTEYERKIIAQNPALYLCDDASIFRGIQSEAMKNEKQDMTYLVK